MTDPAAAPVPEGESPETADTPEAEEKWPFTFILTIVMVSLYLGWRLVQGLILLWNWIF